MPLKTSWPAHFVHDAVVEGVGVLGQDFSANKQHFCGEAVGTTAAAPSEAGDGTACVIYYADALLVVCVTLGTASDFCNRRMAASEHGGEVGNPRGILLCVGLGEGSGGGNNVRRLASRVAVSSQSHMCCARRPHWPHWRLQLPVPPGIKDEQLQQGSSRKCNEAHGAPCHYCNVASGSPRRVAKKEACLSVPSKTSTRDEHGPHGAGPRRDFKV